MPYGKTLVDTIESSGNLSVTGNVTTSGTITSSTGTTYPLVSGTAQNTTSGTYKDFTGIPSWVKRITVIYNGVSLSGTANLLVQIGTGGVPTTSGYSSTSSYALASSSGTNGVTSTSGYVMYIAASAYIFSGHMVLTNVSGNTWICSGLVSNLTSVPYTGQMAGLGSTSATLDMVRITTTNGTDTFDAGSVNIMYE